jgi:hypothetical protein
MGEVTLVPRGVYDHKNTRTPIYTTESIERSAAKHRGLKRTQDQNNRKSEIMKGKNAGSRSPNWKGGITPINHGIRHSREFKLWREAVFKRDNYTCVWCGIRNGVGVGKTIVLHPDHIKPFALYPELRFAIDNGRTLCVDCHKKTGTWGYTKLFRRLP